ncbi:CueP family metal-binding protein [Actinomycetaceae bacterium L2_0104]
MKTRIFASLAAAGLLLAACASEDASTDPTPSAASSQSSASSNQKTDVLESHGLADLNGKELIEELDTLPVAERPQDFMASIRPSEILVSDTNQVETSIPVPEDEFYLSFAPYVTSTHECYFHSLTTCRGELANEDIHVLITDDESGEVLVDEDTTTYDNGFKGVWLPKGIEAKLTVTADGLSASETISTKTEDDLTCLTTLKLS